jgi:hypothetical protein
MSQSPEIDSGGTSVSVSLSLVYQPGELTADLLKRAVQILHQLTFQASAEKLKTENGINFRITIAPASEWRADTLVVSEVEEGTLPSYSRSYSPEVPVAPCGFPAR